MRSTHLDIMQVCKCVDMQELCVCVMTDDLAILNSKTLVCVCVCVMTDEGYSLGQSAVVSTGATGSSVQSVQCVFL